jgi:hypothetical protein
VKLDLSTSAEPEAAPATGSAAPQAPAEAPKSTDAGAAVPFAQLPAEYHPQAVFFRLKQPKSGAEAAAHLTEDLARTALEPFGTLTDVRVATDTLGKSKDFGVAMFQDAAAASTAINAAVSKDAKLAVRPCKTEMVTSWLAVPKAAPKPVAVPSKEVSKANVARALVLKPRAVKK